MASQDEFSSWMLVHLKGLICAKYPILLIIRLIRCTSKKELHSSFQWYTTISQCAYTIPSQWEAVVASMVVRGHQPPGGSSEWSWLVRYNNQILEGAAGGGNGLAFVKRRVVASTSAMHEPMFHTEAYNEGAAIHRRKRNHPSPGVRWAVAWGWGGCWRLVGAARVWQFGVCSFAARRRCAAPLNS